MTIDETGGRIDKKFEYGDQEINAILIYKKVGETIHANAVLFFYLEPCSAGTVTAQLDAVRVNGRLLVASTITDVLYADKPQYAWVDINRGELSVTRTTPPTEEMKRACEELMKAVDLHNALDSSMQELKELFNGDTEWHR